MHYVVTGGSGFIGSNLTEALSVNHDVTIIDNLSTGRRENLDGLVDLENVTFVEGSITDLDLLMDAFHNKDGIFHQGAIPSVPRSVADPIATNKAGIDGTLNVLVAAKECGVRKVVYASSSSVYGDTPTLPKHEGMIPNPMSPYAVTKITGEYYCSVFSRLYDLQTVCLRYFNVFGPRQDPASTYSAVIPKFVNRLLAGEAPVIYGDGEQTRDFTYIKNVIQANVKAMESDASGVFNIACGDRISLNKLATTIMEILDIGIEPVYEASRPGDVRDSLADISAARSAFGYEPEYTMKQGLEETIQWYKNQ
ncbi:SDR family oxidoreductase [Methanogenium sp. S4BF]|uniref:SDR family oxidoreductase n=1 Tax=Methanogenium sp. S4BF TaxID=1789226 RepID=UPI002416D1D1|nr:SDR family oxidoreductase [Methanogenium sp. S4BF]WFN34989.1 SDR family oxidoreductase [Methanogenium sp. S4BF]